MREYRVRDIVNAEMGVFVREQKRWLKDAVKQELEKHIDTEAKKALKEAEKARDHRIQSITKALEVMEGGTDERKSLEKELATMLVPNSKPRGFPEFFAIGPANPVPSSGDDAGKSPEASQSSSKKRDNTYL